MDMWLVQHKNELRARIYNVNYTRSTLPMADPDAWLPCGLSRMLKTKTTGPAAAGRHDLYRGRLHVPCPHANLCPLADL